MPSTGFADGVELAGAAAGVESAFDGVAVDLAAEPEGFTGFGAEEDVVVVDGALEAAGLVGAFKVAGDGVAFLLQFDVFGVDAAVGIFGGDGPFAFDVDGGGAGQR